MTKTGVLKNAGAFAAVLFAVIFLAAFSSNESNEAETLVTAQNTAPAAEETADETVVIESETTAETTTAANAPMSVDAMMEDRFLGDADAPVTVIEYASMTCMHCATFHNEHLGKVKSDLIESGQVKFIFREFPLDAVALRASMMARCAPKDKFFGLLEVLFANQKRWVGASDPIDAMTKMGKLAGLSDTEIDACLANKELETALLETRQNAQAKYNVNSTPSFVFNDGAIVESGVLPAARIQEIVEGLE